MRQLHRRGTSARTAMSIATSLAATAAVALAAAPAVAKDIKVCLIAGKTGALEAYAKQTENGFMLGLEYLTKGTHEGRRRQARDPRQGRPAQARPRQVAAGGVLQRRQGRHRRRHHRLADRARHAARGRGEEEGPDRRAGGGRLDHRRQVEPLHLPHRAAAPTRTRWRMPPPCPASGEVSLGMLGLDTAFGRDGVAAFKEALAGIRPNVKIVAEEYAAGNTADFAPFAERLFNALKDKPRQEDHRLHLGRPAPDGQVRRHEARPLRHRAGAGRQHPARHERMEAVRRHRGRHLLLLRLPQERDERLAQGRVPEALQRAAGLLRGGRLRGGRPRSWRACRRPAPPTPRS